MLVKGRWHLFDDGVLRPVIDAFVQTPSGTWQTVMLLLDAGADRTVFEARLLSMLEPLAVPAEQALELGGIGGKVGCLFVQGQLGFVQNAGRLATVKGPFGVFTERTSCLYQ